MVRVVVVNYDGGAVTLRCIDALLATEYPTTRLEVVVVDNASVDGVVWTLAERYPSVRVIVSDVNEGFARGCNLALDDLDAVDFVALINNDAVVEPGWLWPLVETCSADGVGAACPKLLLNVWVHAVHVRADVRHVVCGHGVGVGVIGIAPLDGASASVRFDERFWSEWEIDEPYRRARWTKQPSASCWWPTDVPLGRGSASVAIECLGPDTVEIGDPGTMVRASFDAGRHVVQVVDLPARRVVNSAGGGLYTGWHGGDRGFLEPDVGQFDEPCEVFGWCGGAVLLSADYLREVGVFDPRFFLYYEDFDLSLRGRARGWTYRYDPRSVVLHEHAWSSKEGSDFFRFWVDRNRRLTLVKNAPPRVALRAVAGIFVTFPADTVRYLVGQLRLRRPPSPRWLLAELRRMWRVAAPLPAVWRERRREARHRRVSFAELEAWMVHK